MGCNNGVAGRINQPLNTMGRGMMLQYKSYAPLWGEVMMYAACVNNVTLTTLTLAERHDTLLKP
jgi:hypothetical protein